MKLTVRNEWGEDGDEAFLRVWRSVGPATHTHVTDGNIGPNFDVPQDQFDYLREAWPRYLAEKAKRSVVVSAATMRPMGEAPMDGTRVLLLDRLPRKDGATGPVVAFFDAAGWGEDEVDPLGWWPLPDLTPMPEEFEGWDA